jgi:hypothetical protein
MKRTEPIASLGPIEGHKCFFQISENESLRRSGLHLSLSEKSSFHLPVFETSRTKPVLLRLSLAGNPEKPCTYVTLWDRMEGAWLWTQLNISLISVQNSRLKVLNLKYQGLDGVDKKTTDPEPHHINSLCNHKSC